MLIILAIALVYVVKNNKRQGDKVIYPEEGSANSTVAPPITDISSQEEVLAPPAPPAD